MEERIVEVDADRLEEISKTYSADVITEGRIRGVFKFERQFYVSIGGWGKGNIEYEATCYMVVRRQSFKGKVKNYKDKKGYGYHGILVKLRGQDWVMVKPPIVFKLKEGSVRTEQLSLF